MSMVAATHQVTSSFGGDNPFLEQYLYSIEKIENAAYYNEPGEIHYLNPSPSSVPFDTSNINLTNLEYIELSNLLSNIFSEYSPKPYDDMQSITAEGAISNISEYRNTGSYFLTSVLTEWTGTGISYLTGVTYRIEGVDDQLEVTSLEYVIKAAQSMSTSEVYYSPCNYKSLGIGIELEYTLGSIGTFAKAIGGNPAQYEAVIPPLYKIGFILK